MKNAKFYLAVILPLMCIFKGNSSSVVYHRQATKPRRNTLRLLLQWYSEPHKCPRNVGTFIGILKIYISVSIFTKKK